jgi:hypothetical protein
MRRGHDEEITDGTKQSTKSRIAELESALKALLDVYVSGAASGDWGNWDYDSDPEIVGARKALGIVPEGVPA